MGSNILKEPKRKFPADEERRRAQMMHRHRHNAAHGSVVFAQKSLLSLEMLPSLTDDAREIAAQLKPLLEGLANEMYLHRKELDGTIKVVKHSESSEDYRERHREAHERFMAEFRQRKGIVS